jgi:hypothetical protein
LAIRVLTTEVGKHVKALLRDLYGGSLLGHGAMDGVIGSHLELASTSNGGLLLSKDGLLLGGQVGESLRLGNGRWRLLLLGVHGIRLHVGAVAVVVVFWKVFAIFVSCVAHFKSAALFVFGHVWVLLEVEEGDEFSRARGLFHAGEAGTGTPLVQFLTEGVVFRFDEAELTRSAGSLTTLGVNEGDRRVDDCTLRRAADCSQVWERRGEIEEPAIEGLTSSALNSIMGCPALGRVCPTRRALGGSRLLVLVLLVLGGLGCGGGGWRGLRSVALGGRGRGGVGVDGHRRGERKKVRLE